jgi:hypothetical protein
VRLKAQSLFNFGGLERLMASATVFFPTTPACSLIAATAASLAVSVAKIFAAASRFKFEARRFDGPFVLF